MEVDTKEYPKMLYKDGKGTVAHDKAEENALRGVEKDEVLPPIAANTSDVGKPEETPPPDTGETPLYEPPTEEELASKSVKTVEVETVGVKGKKKKPKG